MTAPYNPFPYLSQTQIEVVMDKSQCLAEKYDTAVKMERAVSAGLDNVTIVHWPCPCHPFVRIVSN